MSSPDDGAVIRFGCPSLCLVPVRINHVTIITEINSRQTERPCPDL
jgi:hypothetical protein